MTTITGGPGDDFFYETLGDGVTAIDGGGGFNSLIADWSATSDPITSTSAGPDSGAITDVVTGQSLTYSQIQNLNLSGGSGDDLIIGTGGPDFLGGSPGNDTIVGGGGDDFISGGGNTVAVFSGNRADYSIYSQNGLLVVAGPDGMDTLSGVNHLKFADGVFSPVQSFDFSGSSDSYKVTFSLDTGSGSIVDVTTGAVTAFAGAVELYVTTGSGDDTFAVTATGASYYYGGGGNLASFSFDGGAGQNHFSGDFEVAPIDFALGAYPALSFPAYPFNNTSGYLANIQTVDVTSAGEDNTVTGGDGADVLTTGRGDNSIVDGGAGNDTVTGGFEVLGGPGDDVLYGGTHGRRYQSTGTMVGGPGDDTLYGLGIVGSGPIGNWQAGEVAIYSGDQAAYSITTDSQGVTTVKDLRPGSPDGTDTLINVAQLQFADVTLDLLNGPEVVPSPQSNGLVEAGAGTAGTPTAVIVARLSDTAGTPFFTDGFNRGPLTGLVQMFGDYGSAVLDTATGQLTYTLDNANPSTNALRAGDVVTDSFFINAADGGFIAQGAFVTFTIQGANDAPTPGADSVTTSYATPVTISAASLLANDSDPEGDALSLTAVGGAQHGSVSLSGGVVTFTPDVGYGEVAGFDYTVDDGNGGTATGHVTVNVTGTAPANINHAGVAASETIDTTGDTLSHNIVTGSGDDTVFTGSGGSSVRLGAGTDVVVGGTGKDIVTFGPGLGTVTGGAGPDNFIFAKGQIADPASHGGQYDTVTDFTGAGSAYVAGRDFIYLKGFAHTATITYEHDLSGDPTAHLYRVDDGAYHAEFVLDYAGAGVALSHSQYGFL